MRLSLFLPAMAAIFIITGPLLSQEPVSVMERAKQIMAIRAAAKRVIDDSKAFLDAPRTRAAMLEKMMAFMKTDIPAHRNRAASRKLCLEYARRSIQDLLVSNVVMAAADASAHSPLPVTAADVLANVDSNWTGSADQVAGGFTERHFEGVFTEAREKNTAGQRFDVEKKISYPPYPVLNKELTRRAGARAQLARADFDATGKWLANEDLQKLPPLFEEVQAALDAIYKNIGNEIAVQYEHQNTLVRQSVSNRNDLARHLTASGIHDRVISICRGEMQKTAREAPKSGGGLTAPVYELFDLTDACVQTNASRLETEFFSDYVRSLTNAPLSSRDLERTIIADPAAHKNARQSSELLNKKFAGDLNGWAATSYVMRPETDSSFRNKATLNYFTSRLAGPGTEASAWKECVKRALANYLKGAREDIARRQVDKYFPRLGSMEVLPDATVNILAEKRNFTPFKSLVELRESMPELMPAEKDAAILLEETEALAIDKANQLNLAAEKAVRGQELCLREMEKEKMPQLEQQVAARKPFAEISSEWADELSKRWSIQVQKTPSPYRALLARTSELLNKTVRQLYDAKSATAEKKSTREDSSKRPAPIVAEEKSRTPQSASGGGAAAEAKASKKTRGDTTADLFLIIRDVGKNDCEALLETEDGSVLAKITFNPDQADSAAEKVFSAFRNDVHGLIASRQTVSKGALFGLLPGRRSGLKELGIYIVAPSSRVRLKTSLLIRERMENLIDQWAQEASSAAPKLRWGTGFSNDGEKKLEK